MVVENFCSIRAEFHQPISNVEHEIIITPKMSFGTVHHATTYMMIEQMKEIHFRGKAVFDFGTGTGILAILAEKLGAADISAIDADDRSIENAKENIVKNNCSKISVCLSSQIPSQKFNIILANISRNVILEYLPQLSKSLAFNGQLLLSGLLAGDKAELTKASSQLNFLFIRRIEKMNRISLC